LYVFEDFFIVIVDFRGRKELQMANDRDFFIFWGTPIIGDWWRGLLLLSILNVHVIGT